MMRMLFDGFIGRTGLARLARRHEMRWRRRSAGDDLRWMSTSRSQDFEEAVPRPAS